MLTPIAPDDGQTPSADAGGAGILPAHLARFAPPAAVRTDYPLVLRAEGGLAQPVSEWLDALAVRAAGPASRMIRDNAARLERAVSVALADSAEADARTILTAAGAAMVTELALRPGPAAELEGGLAAMVRAVPGEARILSYSRQAGLRLYREAALAALRDRRAALAEALEQVRAQLADLVAVEDTRAPAAHTADAVRATLGEGLAGAFDPAALANVVGRRRGARGLDPRALDRARAALRLLSGHTLGELPAVVVCHAGSLPDDLDLGPGVVLVRADDALQAAVDRFDAYAAQAAKVHAAARAARLFVRWAYNPDHHDARVDTFSWRDMTPDELLALPRVLAVEEAGVLVGETLARLLVLLRGARPVQVMVETRPARALHDDRLQVDLGALAMALDRPYVAQSTPARAAHFLQTATRAIACAAPALHVVATGFFDEGEPAVGAWLAAGAAVDARAHPLFRYDPLSSGSWAGRLDVEGNPQPEAAWPRHPVDDGAAPVAFTLADYALLDPTCRDAYRPASVVDAPRCQPVDAWAALGAEEAFDHLPAVDAVQEGRPVRLVVSTAMAEATAERGRRWRLLAEMAGVENAFAIRAAADARAEAQRAAEVREAQLRDAHAAELERVRSTAAAEALSRLADALLSPDLFSAPTTAPTPRAPAAREAPAPASPGITPPAPAAAETAPAPQADAFDEPWIDSPLCTTCNDCINLNPLMFAYDANKQATLKDAGAGTFAQLVKAAEKCPARCIHPGKPQNPAEPGLAELVARAAPFNR